MSKLPAGSPQLADMQKQFQAHTAKANQAATAIQSALEHKHKSSAEGMSQGVDKALGEGSVLTPENKAKLNQALATHRGTATKGDGGAKTSGLLDNVKKTFSNLATTSSTTSDIASHLKQNWGKYALGATGLAALAAYAVYRNKKEDEEEEEAIARRKEREIRALQRMARAQETS